VLYGLYVEHVLGAAAAGVWLDERSWCHTYWGPGPLAPARVEDFVNSIAPDDIAFSVAGYTDSDETVVRRATALVLERVAG
jgi:hypothetical protein